MHRLEQTHMDKDNPGLQPNPLKAKQLLWECVPTFIYNKITLPSSNTWLQSQGPRTHQESPSESAAKCRPSLRGKRTNLPPVNGQHLRRGNNGAHPLQASSKSLWLPLDNNGCPTKTDVIWMWGKRTWVRNRFNQLLKRKNMRHLKCIKTSLFPLSLDTPPLPHKYRSPHTGPKLLALNIISY